VDPSEAQRADRWEAEVSGHLRGCYLRNSAGPRSETHAAYSVLEFHDTVREYMKTPIELLDELGLLRPTLNIGHGNFISDNPNLNYALPRDLELMGRAGVTISHCPINIVRRARVLDNWKKYGEAGVNISIGSDTYPRDMIMNMRTACYMGKITRGDAVTPRLIQSGNRQRRNRPSEATLRCNKLSVDLVKMGVICVGIAIVRFWSPCPKCQHSRGHSRITAHAAAPEYAAGSSGALSAPAGDSRRKSGAPCRGWCRQRSGDRYGLQASTARPCRSCASWRRGNRRFLRAASYVAPESGALDQCLPNVAANLARAVAARFLW